MRQLLIENKEGETERLSDRLISFIDAGDSLSDASSLEEAVSMAGRNPFDIIFVDAGLSEFENTDVLFELKQVVNCPVVLLYTGGQEHRAEAAIAKGASDTLQVSMLNALRFQQVVEHNIERHKLEQEKQKLIAELVEASFENQKILNQLQQTNAQMAQEIELRNKIETRNALLVKAIHQISDEVVISDLNHRVLYRNNAFRQNRSAAPDYINSHTMVEMFAIGDDQIAREIRNAMREGEDWRGKITRTDENDCIITEQLSVFPIRDESYEVVNYIAIRHDVTRETELEQRLTQSQKLQSIGQLAAGIAHEINTPVQYVSDNVNFLEASFSDLAKVLFQHKELIERVRLNQESVSYADKCIEEIENADMEFLLGEIPLSIKQSAEGLDRISKIVTAMKEFAHPGTAEKISADLNKAIRSTVQVCANEWKYIADMELDLEDGLAYVPCYIGELNQVFLNMIVNAVHAIEERKLPAKSKGTISIQTRMDDSDAIVVIRDTGNGIPSGIIEKIFDPFFTTKEVGKGTGQGLSLAYSTIVEMHGGSIHVESQTGQGTVFTIRLPLNKKM
jgi:two-component system, NtrC family, sensor kinase